MTTTTPAADWGTIEIDVGLTAAYVFTLYEGDGETPLVIEATDLLRFFLWDTDAENPSDINTNSGPASDTFTADAGTDVITSSAAHKLDNGVAVQLTTTDTLPAGLSLLTTYYVVARTETTFQLSATRGGAAINITDAGTGTHTWTKGSRITVDTVGVPSTTPAQVTVVLDEWDTAGLTPDVEYQGLLVLIDDDDRDRAKKCGRGIVRALGVGGGQLGLGG